MIEQIVIVWKSTQKITHLSDSKRSSCTFCKRDFWTSARSRWEIESICTWIEERLVKATTRNLDDLDGIKVAGTLQPQDSIDGQLGKEILVLRENLGGDGRPGDVHQVLPELDLVLHVAQGRVLQSLQSDLRCLTPTSNYGLGKDAYEVQLRQRIQRWQQRKQQ